MPKHERTLAAVFTVPTRADLAWHDIESLLRLLGAEVTEGRGFRVRACLNEVRAVFHRPHPCKEATKGCVESVRLFLQEVGIGDAES